MKIHYLMVFCINNQNLLNNLELHFYSTYYVQYLMK